MDVSCERQSKESELVTAECARDSILGAFSNICFGEGAHNPDMKRRKKEQLEEAWGAYVRFVDGRVPEEVFSMYRKADGIYWDDVVIV